MEGSKSMLIQNALSLSGVRDEFGKFYYACGDGRTVRPYARELGKNVYDYRKYLLFARYGVNGNLISHELHDNILDYMISVRSTMHEYDSSEYSTVHKYFRPEIRESPVKLSGEDCILIYPDSKNANFWFIWNPDKNYLDFMDYDEDKFGMADVRTSTEYERRYGEVNPSLLKSLKDFRKTE